MLRMDQGSSSIDLASWLQRLTHLESQVAAQQATLAEQQGIIAEQRATIAVQQEALQTAHEQITLLRKALFAPKRERYVPSPDQQVLFESVLLEGRIPESPPSTSETAMPKPRRHRRKFVFPDFLPVVHHEHKLSDEECRCGGCGQARIIINTLITKQIEIERAKAHIEEHVRYTYACPKCRDGGQMQTTAKPPTPLEKSPFGASVLAWIISAKFERHLPTYRHQEMLLEPLGMWLSRPLLANLLRGSADVLRPLSACGLQELLRSDVIQVDETPVKYLGDEKGKASTGYLFGYGGNAEHRFLYYDYRADRSRAGPVEILANYQGVLLTDGFSG